MISKKQRAIYTRIISTQQSTEVKRFNGENGENSEFTEISEELKDKFMTSNVYYAFLNT